MRYSAFSVGLIVVSLLAPIARADNFTAKVYSLDAKNPQLLYNLSSVDTQSGGHTEIHAAFRFPDGRLAASEFTELDGGDSGRIMKYTADLELPPAHGLVEVRNGRVYFSHTADGKTKTDDEKLGDTLVVPPTTVAFIRAHWDAILKGDTVDARFAAVERRETVGFKFFKSDTRKSGGRDVVIVTMKPTSFIIAAIRSPMTFVFDQASRRVLEFRGQIIPKRDGKDQDADIQYQISWPKPARR